MAATLAPGDPLVCCFHVGHEGNPISLAPDGKVAVLDRRQVTSVQMRVPYVCTVKAVGPKNDEGQPRSYVLRVDRALEDGDYDHVVGADFVKATLTLQLRYPTHFQSLLTRTVPAAVEEARAPESTLQHPVLEIRLRHGNHVRGRHVTLDQALRLGHRINIAVPHRPPAVPLQPFLRHPRPRAPGAAWRATLDDHTTYLLFATPSLVAATRDVLADLGQETLARLATARLATILATARYDPVSPDSRDEIHLEWALTAFSRLSLGALALPEPLRRLAVAEKRVLRARLRHQPAAMLAAVLRAAGIACEPLADRSALRVPLDAYLRAAASLKDGAWRLCNQQVELGNVVLPVDRAAVVVAEAAARIPRKDPCPEPLRPLVEALAGQAADLWTAISQEQPAEPRGNPLDLGRYPPCVAHTLHAALQRGLSHAEAHNAAAFLSGAGLAPDHAHRMLHGDALPAAPRRRPAPIPCSVNRSLGICAWNCPGTRTPLDYQTTATEDPHAAPG